MSSIATLAGMRAKPTVSRRDLLRFRVRRHQLDRPPGNARSRLSDILDYGLQDTGGDGATWALANRGAPPNRDGIVLAWTLRGAPHAYRRDDIEAIAVATAPYTEDDASKRVFTASKPFRAAGLPILDAMRTMAEHQRRIVTKPTVKGEVSRQLAEDLDDTFLRWCNPCQAVHPYEQLFRLPALQAGLVLDWDTSPPVLRRLTQGEARVPPHPRSGCQAALRRDSQPSALLPRRSSAGRRRVRRRTHQGRQGLLAGRTRSRSQ